MYGTETQTLGKFLGKKAKLPKAENLLIACVILYLIICAILYYRSYQNLDFHQSIAAKQMKVVFKDKNLRTVNGFYNPNKSSLFKYIGNGVRKDPALQLVGFMTINEKHTFLDNLYSKDNSSDWRSYIESGFWTLKNNHESYAIYYLKNDQAYVHYLKTANLPRRSERYLSDRLDADSAFFKSVFSELPLKSKDKVVPFRYNIVSNQLRIPVGEKHLLAWRIFFFSILCIIVGLSLFAIWNFLKFLVAVSLGNPFSTKNINRLKFIAYFLLLFPIPSLIFGLLQPIIFKSHFTDDLMFNYGFFFSRYKIYMACLAFLLLLKAFKRGKALQEEQDLTV